MYIILLGVSILGIIWVIKIISQEKSIEWSSNLIMVILLDNFFLEIVVTYIKLKIYQESIGDPTKTSYKIRKYLENSNEANQFFTQAV